MDKDLAEKLMGKLPIPMGGTAIFLKNFKDMRDADTHYADKYFHSKANCATAQSGDIPTALLFSLGRELFDSTFNNPIRKKLPLEENIKDCKEDLYADFYGLGKGLIYPSKNCSELVDIFRPNGLDEKY